MKKNFCNYYSALGMLKYWLGVKCLYNQNGECNSIDYFFKVPAVDNAENYHCYKAHSDVYGWCVHSTSTGKVLLAEKPFS